MTNNPGRKDFDILIAGGGMVGAMAALALAGKGLRIALLDGVGFHPDRVPNVQAGLHFDSRVSAIAPASRRQFETLGCWTTMTSLRVSPYTDMHVWDADGTGQIHFAAADIHANELGHIIENSVILQGLYAQLARATDVSVIVPAFVESLQQQESGMDTWTTVITESGEKYSCHLLLGADGGNSRIRELAGIRVREWDYEQQAIVTTVRTELGHQATAWQRFISTGPLAFLPLLPATGSDDQHYCSIVWSAVPDCAESLMGLSDVEFSRTLQHAIENRFGRIEWVDRRSAFPLRQRHALDYVKDGIALLGDAAHTIHPLAGQGVNLGLADVQVLAEEICSNLQRGRPVNDPIMLQRYQRRRLGHNLGTMWMMEGFKRLFAQQSLPLRWIRNAGMRGVDNSSLIKNRLIRQATGY
ncbi:MAG: UbiH/UbiF/VisC/COQ6 family ubiquinone biosynthesis hydroxylase [Pseudohongiellaceae bacterium]